MICSQCLTDFPEELVQPLFSTRGNCMLCAICALKFKNQLHGLNDTEFRGPKANELLKRTKLYLKKNNV